jgi:8-oxo-dGTP diphosphatase
MAGLIGRRAMAMTAIDVAVNVVRDPDGKVLLAERTARQMGAGFWELPGGKIDPGETPQQAAARELVEEIGITAESLTPLMTYEHAFPTKRVRLHIFRVGRWSGAPRGREGQRLAWIDPLSPHISPLLPSNLRVLTALGLPPLMEVLELAGPAPALLAHVHEAFSAGVRLIQVCGPNLAPDQRVNIARRISEIAHRFGARVLLAGSALEVGRAGATGMHSTAEAFARMTSRPPVSLWSVSCTGANDLARAQALGADLAVVSPVLACATRPLLGWEGLRRLVAESGLPIYARGGLEIGHLAEALRVGAAGIAVNAERVIQAIPHPEPAPSGGAMRLH